MEKPTLETLEVAGTPRELGRGQGEALRERIRAFVDVRLAAVHAYFSERGQTGATRILDVGKHASALFAQWDPDGYEEHVGIAEAANVDPGDLYSTTNLTDMRDAVLLSAPSGAPLERKSVEGCSSVLVPPNRSRRGLSVVGQTWDLNPPDVEYVVAIHRRPKNGLRTWSVTCAGSLSLMGINEAGFAVGTTNIKTFGSRIGVGYLSVLHRLIRERSVSAASEIVVQAPIAAAHTYWLADAQEQVEWEASPVGTYRRDTTSGPIARTNHCLSPSLVAIEGEVRQESTLRRLAWLESELGSGASFGVDDLKRLFADRSLGVHSVNRYPEDAQGTATNAVFIAIPAERRAYAWRGPIDRGAMRELGF